MKRAKPFKPRVKQSVRCIKLTVRYVWLRERDTHSGEVTVKIVLRSFCTDVFSWKQNSFLLEYTPCQKGISGKETTQEATKVSIVQHERTATKCIQSLKGATYLWTG